MCSIICVSHDVMHICTHQNLTLFSALSSAVHIRVGVCTSCNKGCREKLFTNCVRKNFTGTEHGFSTGELQCHAGLWHFIFTALFLRLLYPRAFRGHSSFKSSLTKLVADGSTMARGALSLKTYSLERPRRRK